MKQIVTIIKQQWLGWLKMGVVIWIFGISTLVGGVNIYLMLQGRELLNKAIIMTQKQETYTVNCEGLKAFTKVLELQQK